MPPPERHADRRVTIRRAGERDALGVYDVQRRAVAELWAPVYTGAEVQSWLAGLVPGGHLPAIVAKDFLVAVDDTTVVGFSAFDAVTQEISAVYVDPAFLRRGIGRRLLRAAETAARAQGVFLVHLHAALNAVPFYLACGYTLDRYGSMPLRAGGALRCALMSRTLPA